MNELSSAAKESRGADQSMLRHISDSEVGVDDQSLLISGESSERKKSTLFPSDARIQADCIGDESRNESECERLNKYPDYCRTITIRGLSFLHFRRHVGLLAI